MTPRFIVELDSGHVLPLEEARDVRITCLEGTLWVTEERGAGDVLLEAGESHAVATSGLTLVQAIKRTRLAVESLAARPQLAFPPLRAAA